jgi:hypothetical protein
LWRCPTPANLLEYKRCEAVAWNLKLQKQCQSWIQYVGKISSSTTTKETWRKIHSIQGRPISYTSYPLFGVAHDDDLSRATLFSDHFLPVIPVTPPPAAAVTEVVKCISKLKHYDCVPFTPGVFTQSLKMLKNTAPGHDSIMNIFFSKATLLCKQELFSLLNTSWTSGCVPDAWKLRIVVPIPKPGKPLEQVSGYRPITLLPCMGKIMEWMVLSCLQYTLEKKNVFSSLQLGF